MAICFKLTLELVRLPDRDTVHFKVDGGRFEADKTLKLAVNSSYALTVGTRPPQDLRDVTVNGSRLELEETSRDGESAFYTCTFVTDGMEKSQRGSRKKVPLLFQFANTRSLLTNLQCKLYPATDKIHLTWGTPIKVIELDCKIPYNATFVDVVKETYR